DIRRRQRSHEHNLRLRARDGDVEPTLTALLGQDAKGFFEAALGIFSKCCRKNDDVTLVALDAFQIADKKTCVLAVIHTHLFALKRYLEQPVSTSPVLKSFVDSFSLFEVKGDDTNSWRIGTMLRPKLREIVNDGFRLIFIPLESIDAVYP